MSDDKIIPFGKYKGQEIEQVIARDPQYVQWIMQQAWFQEKFQPIYQVVINQFAPPSEDTPAHTVTLDQVRAIFAQDNIKVMLVDDIREQIIELQRGHHG